MGQLDFREISKNIQREQAISHSGVGRKHRSLDMRTRHVIIDPTLPEKGVITTFDVTSNFNKRALLGVFPVPGPAGVR